MSLLQTTSRRDPQHLALEADLLVIARPVVAPVVEHSQLADLGEAYRLQPWVCFWVLVVGPELFESSTARVSMRWACAAFAHKLVHVLHPGVPPYLSTSTMVMYRRRFCGALALSPGIGAPSPPVSTLPGASRLLGLTSHGRPRHVLKNSMSNRASIGNLVMPLPRTQPSGVRSIGAPVRSWCPT